MPPSIAPPMRRVARSTDRRGLAPFYDRMRFAPPLLGACLLMGCGPADNDPGPGGVTVGEARALDEAAEMLEAERPGAEPFVPAGNSADTEPDG